MAPTLQNMTTGKPSKLIVSFALPLMFGSVFQQLYTVVDSVIVGQGVGVEALASIGAADWYNWLVLGMVFSFAQGFGIKMAQEFGADRLADLRRTLRDSCTLMVALTLFTVVVSELSIVPVLKLLGTPENIFAGSETYLRILYGGLPLTALYNFTASVLRSLGDSKTPLYSMIVASVLNIVLDLIFVYPLQWGIAGASIATVLAQGVAGILCLKRLRSIDILRSTEPFALPSLQNTRELLLLGVPLAFQNVIISVGGMVVQSVVNEFGFLFIAGYTATNKLYGLLEMAAISYGHSMTTYAGQNYGAGNLKRVRIGTRSGAFTAFLTSLVVSAAMIAFGKSILLMFINGTPSEVTEVLAVAYRYLCIMSIFLSILYMLHIYRSTLQGLGDTVMPMVSGIVEFLMRVGSVLLLRGWLAGDSIFYAEVFAWAGAVGLLFVVYLYKMRRMEKDQLMPKNE